MNIELFDSLKAAVAHLKRQVFVEGLKRKALIFSFENSKLKGTYTFSLPSGWTCPGASICLAKADRLTGKLTDGPDSMVRCFSASQEAVYPTVRLIRWHNYELLQEAKDTISMANLILESLPTDASLVRIHVAGDYYNQAYFNAWLMVAVTRPNIIFYAYTKSVNFWVANRSNIPENLKLTASVGSRHDELAELHGLKFAKIVLSEGEAVELGLEIDEDDTHAWKQDSSFALLVHGTQKPGSDASKAWVKQLMEIRKENAALPKKEKRQFKAPTIESLTAAVVRLAVRLAGILKTPVYKVKRVVSLAA